MIVQRELTSGVYSSDPVIVPVVDGVTVAVQLAVVALTTVNGLLQALNVPVAVPPFVMATDPAGVEAVPGEMLSLTNAVHVITWPTATDEGAHVTTVDVADRQTTRLYSSHDQLSHGVFC